MEHIIIIIIIIIIIDVNFTDWSDRETGECYNRFFSQNCWYGRCDNTSALTSASWTICNNGVVDRYTMRVRLFYVLAICEKSSVI